MTEGRQQRPADNGDREGWKAYWEARGMLWRTEPEIDEERQRFLADRRAVKPDIKKGIYPFRDENGPIRLTRADVEWLLATHEDGRGPVVWAEERDKPFREQRRGLDLRGADLSQLNLRALPLARIRGGLEGNDWHLASPARREWAAVHIEGSSNMLGELHIEGATLAGAHLEGALLDGDSAEEAIASLEQANLMDAHLEGTRLSHVHLEKAVFAFAHLEGANLWDAYLQGASLQAATLTGAELVGAHLEHASLWDAHLEGRRMSTEDLQRIRAWRMDFPDVLPPADLRRAYFDVDTALNYITLGNAEFGYVSVLGVRWGGVDLSAAKWRPREERQRWWQGPKGIILSDEREARRDGLHIMAWVERDTEVGAQLRLERLEDAARANRQLAIVLRAQGLNDEADHFTYRAHLLQREALWRQKSFGRWAFSLFLWAASGYGYRLWRILAWYGGVLLLFTFLYWLLGVHSFPHEAGIQALWDSFLVSLSAIHGRTTFEQLGAWSPTAWVAAIESVFGIVIEGVFVAMLVQRFFAR